MVAFVVPAVTWYRDRGGNDVLLPSETVVGPPRLLAAAHAGRFAVWTLPAGGYAVDRRQLPLEPARIDDVFPLRSADLPWSVGGGDLARDWRRLFHEREAFEPWGGPQDAELLREYARKHPPRTTFRAAADRRRMRFLFPQLVPATHAYRLGPGYHRLPEALRQACRDVVAAGERVLAQAGGRVERLAADPAAEALTELERVSPFWVVRPPEAPNPLIILPH